MPQLFPSSSNVLARVAVVGAALTPLALMLLGSALSRSPLATKVDVAIDQPVPFSHQHHNTELGIDCRYCHTSVEKSSQAGMPPTETCMSCHSQIWTNSPLLEPVRESYRTGQPIAWNRVNKLPEFVYFNHSLHVKKGVSCNTCHGDIQHQQLAAKSKTFFMAWCLDCHRAPEKFVLPNQEDVFNLYAKNQRREDLTAQELALLEGKDYKRTDAQVAAGPDYIKKYNIKKKQLADCWICHR